MQRITKKRLVLILFVVFIVGIVAFNSTGNPQKLKQVWSNERTTIKNSTEFSMDIESLHLITDEDGYNYLVLNYSITNLTNKKINPDFKLPWIEQNNIQLDEGFLSKKCEKKYRKIIDDNYVFRDIRPHETIKDTRIFEVYDTTSDVYVYISEHSLIVGEEYNGAIVRQFSF